MNVNDNTSVNILKRGNEFSEKKRYTEALYCYHQGIRSLIDKMEVEQNAITKSYLKHKIFEYMDRENNLRRLVLQQAEQGFYREQQYIEANSTGHSYMSVFGRFLDDEVRYVRVEDPYVRSFHQCQNFLRLCELLVHSCVNLRGIELVTSTGDSRSQQTQNEWFGSISFGLARYKLGLNVIFSHDIRDRQVLLSSGWVIKIGRGLDIYKPPADRFGIGAHDMDLRPCHETTVEIHHSKELRQRYG